MIRIVFSTIAGGLALFVASAIFWAMLPVPFTILHDMPLEQTDAMLETLDLPESGVYHFPGFAVDENGKMLEGDARAAHEARYREGPAISMLVYDADGRDMMPAWQFPAAITLTCIAAAVASILLALAAQPSFMRRLAIVITVGVCVGISGNAYHFMWFVLPYDFAGYATFATIMEWIIAAPVFAAIMKPKKPAHEQPMADA